MAKDLSDITSALTGILSGSSKNMIGVDIGISSVKVCEISKGVGGGLTLVNFASESLSEAAIIEDEIQKPTEIIDTIKELISRSGTKAKSACIGLEGPRTMSKRFEVPDGNKEEIEDNVLWEAEQFISFGSDNTEVSHSVMGKTEGGNVDVLVAAANIDMAKAFIELAEQAGLKVKIVDLNVLALSNIFEAIYKSDKKLLEQTNMLVDWGAQATKVVLYQGDGPILTKEINIGSVLATEEIQRSLGISYFEAEDLKLGGQGAIPEDVQEIIWRVNERIVDEVNKTLTFFHSTSGGEQVHKVFITGGGSSMPGVLESLQEGTGVDCHYIEPFEKIKIGKHITDEQVDYIARSGVIALGLALRNS